MITDIQLEKSVDLLKWFEREVCLNYYDPYGQAEDFKYTIDQLREEILRRMFRV